jgi:hypothetical protein
MIYFNGLNMGEGIAGPSDIGMSTTWMLTCMGVALVNRAASRGGLYHYPANTLSNPNVSGTMRQMFNDIRPDEVVLTPAPKDAIGSGGSTHEDITAVSDFFTGLGRSVTLVDTKTSAQLTWVAGSPRFNQPPDGKFETAAPISEATRNTMSVGKRELEGNIWYYGGDGESGEVLEQGRTPAPSAGAGGGGKKSTKESNKGCCVIL